LTTGVNGYTAKQWHILQFHRNFPFSIIVLLNQTIISLEVPMRPSIKQLFLVPILMLTALFLTLTACTPTAGQTVPITVTRVLPTATITPPPTELMPTSLPIPDSTTLIPPLPGMVYSTDSGLWRIGTDGQAIKLTNRRDGTLSPDGRYFLYQEDGDFWVVETTETAQPVNLTAASEREHTRAQWWPGRPGTILIGRWKLSPHRAILPTTSWQKLT
jgi:hypothetical protein